jgi:hypothetical protein
MRSARCLLVTALAVLAVSGTSACQVTGGTAPTTRPTPGPTAGPTSGPTRGPTTAPVPNGTPVVSFRGTQGSGSVDCIAVDSEFALSAHSDRMRWTATPSVKSVVVSPASGELAEGATVVLRVRGSSRGAFTVHVEAPNRTGSGSADVPFTCR